MTTSSVNNTDDWTKFYNQLENQAVNNYTNQAKQAESEVKKVDNDTWQDYQ